jgi:capsular polysaccharide biosynthesis protein
VNLLSIARKIWRYKLATLPVILLTLFGAAYVVAVKEPVYEASSSYVLINPPAPPTPEEIARDPTLGRVNSDNPYARFTDQSVVVEVLASAMASESAQHAVLKAGADSRYTVTPDSDSGIGYSSPILEIAAQGGSPQAAVRTAKLVGHEITRQLDRMQEVQDVDSQYRITAQPVDPPDGARLRPSGQLRVLVGVLALGVVLLFVVVSVADALNTLRMERRGRAAPSRLEPNDDEPWSAGDRSAEGLSGLHAEEWSEFDGDSLGDSAPVELFPAPDPEATVPTNGRHAGHLRRGRRRSSG